MKTPPHWLKGTWTLLTSGQVTSLLYKIRMVVEMLSGRRYMKNGFMGGVRAEFGKKQGLKESSGHATGPRSCPPGDPPLPVDRDAPRFLSQHPPCCILDLTQVSGVMP